MIPTSSIMLKTHVGGSSMKVRMFVHFNVTIKGRVLEKKCPSSIFETRQMEATSGMKRDIWFDPRAISERV